jgi:6-pyruvoyltetrahydropterin/6-carboxytetrahydropterin synthase
VPFDQRDPTTEVMAREIYETAVAKLHSYATKDNPRYPLRHAVKLISVKVWETSSSWAEYAPA